MCLDAITNHAWHDAGKESLHPKIYATTCSHVFMSKLYGLTEILVTFDTVVHGIDVKKLEQKIKTLKK